MRKVFAGYKRNLEVWKSVMFLIVNAALVFSMLDKKVVLDSRGSCTIVARFIPSFAVEQSAQLVFNEAG